MGGVRRISSVRAPFLLSTPDCMTCPNCGSERSRRGGWRIWAVYLALIAAGIPAVLIARLHAGLVAAVMLAIIVLAHLLFGERVCLECGTQWRPRRDDN